MSKLRNRSAEEGIAWETQGEIILIFFRIVALLFDQMSTTRGASDEGRGRDETATLSSTIPPENRECSISRKSTQNGVSHTTAWDYLKEAGPYPTFSSYLLLGDGVFESKKCPPDTSPLRCMVCFRVTYAGFWGDLIHKVCCKDCGLHVHTKCYGVNSEWNLETAWLCDLCRKQKSRKKPRRPSWDKMKCGICETNTSPLTPRGNNAWAYVDAWKKTNKHHPGTMFVWVHLVCALWESRRKPQPRIGILLNSNRALEIMDDEKLEEREKQLRMDWPDEADFRREIRRVSDELDDDFCKVVAPILRSLRPWNMDVFENAWSEIGKDRNVVATCCYCHSEHGKKALWKCDFGDECDVWFHILCAFHTNRFLMTWKEESDHEANAFCIRHNPRLPHETEKKKKQSIVHPPSEDSGILPPTLAQEGKKVKGAHNRLLSAPPLAGEMCQILGPMNTGWETCKVLEFDPIRGKDGTFRCTVRFVNQTKETSLQLYGHQIRHVY